MSRMGWPWGAVALFFGVALAAGGCGGSRLGAGTAYKDPYPLPADTMTLATAEIGTHGGRFVIGQTSSPKTFNAMMANENSSTDITNQLFAGLTDFNYVTQKDTPLLAKSWDVSPDGLVWTWHLRRGARFSDGHPITSEDVLFSFRLAYDDSLHPVAQDLLKVGGKKMEVSAPDSYTVVTKIASPYALMIPAIGSLRIMPQHVLESAHRRGQYAAAYNTSISPDSLVTSGAWRLKQFVPGEKTVLTRNPYWFGVDAKGQRLPYLDELVFLIVPDQNTAALKFKSGDLDGLDNVRPEDYQGYADRQEKENFTLYDLGPAVNTNFFWFNLNKVHKSGIAGKKVGDPYVDRAKYAWFNNRVFRRAVSMAIDRDAIIKSVMFGDGVKNWSNATPGNKTWYWPELPHYDYNLEESKKLLAGLGWKDKDGDGILEDGNGTPISFTLKTNGDNAVRMQMCTFIKDDLAKVGIRCIPTGVDFNGLITNVREDFQYEAALLGGQSGVPPDPGMFQNVYRSSGITHWWHMKQAKPETPMEAAIDRLMDENVGTLDLAKRHQTFNEMQKIVNDECFIVWLPTIVAKVPVRNRFGNLQPSVLPHRLLWNIDRVFVKSRQPA